MQKTATKSSERPEVIAAPTGLRVSEKLLRDYRALQDRLASPQLDRHHRDHVAERLESKIFQATDIFPWTPAEVVYWVFAWLHVLAYGEEAKTRKRYQSFYGPIPGKKRGLFPEWAGTAWVLKYPDIDMIVELLDEGDKDRAIP